MKEIPVEQRYLKLLEGFPICRLLDERGKALLFSRVKVVLVRAGETILQQDTIGADIFIIGQGMTRVWRDEDGQETEFAVLGKEDIFGEMSAITNTPRSANVTAKSDTALFVITRETIADLLKINPEFREFLSQLGLHREEENFNSLF